MGCNRATIFLAHCTTFRNDGQEMIFKLLLLVILLVALRMIITDLAGAFVATIPVALIIWLGVVAMSHSNEEDDDEYL